MNEGIQSIEQSVQQTVDSARAEVQTVAAEMAVELAVPAGTRLPEDSCWRRRSPHADAVADPQTRQSGEQGMSDNEDSFMSHLIELRDRMIRALLSIPIVFLCLFPWAKDCIHARPAALATLPKRGQMIATDVVGVFRCR